MELDVYDGLAQYNSIRISTDLVVPMETYLNMMTTVGAFWGYLCCVVSLWNVISRGTNVHYSYPYSH